MAETTAIKELRGILKEVAKTLQEVAKEQKKTELAQQKTELAQQKTELAQQKTELAHQKTEKSLRESQQKTEEALRDSQQKTEEALRESQQKTEEALRELAEEQKKTEKTVQKASGDFANKWGEFLENFVEGDLPGLFHQWGISEVSSVASRLRKKDSNGQPIAEYDLVVHNGSAVIVIEVKTVISEKKTSSFVKKLKLFKKYFPHYSNHQIFGGIAYMSATSALLNDAAKNGLFLIQAPGGQNKVTKITNSDGFTPTAY